MESTDSVMKDIPPSYPVFVLIMIVALEIASSPGPFDSRTLYAEKRGGLIMCATQSPSNAA